MVGQLDDCISSTFMEDPLALVRPLWSITIDVDRLLSVVKGRFKYGLVGGNKRPTPIRDFGATAGDGVRISKGIVYGLRRPIQHEESICVIYVG